MVLFVKSLSPDNIFGIFLFNILSIVIFINYDKWQNFNKHHFNEHIDGFNKITKNDKQ